MKTLVIGAGPAGLACAYLLKEAIPDAAVLVVERLAESSPRGWGITLPPGAIELGDEMPFWSLRGTRKRRGGELLGAIKHQTLGTISRPRLVELLVTCCRSIGVEVAFERDARDLTERELAFFDLVVAADGAASRMRERFSHQFRSTSVAHPTRFIWLGLARGMDWLDMFASEDRSLPAVAWCYGHAPSSSTAVVEMRASDWLALGFGQMPTGESVKRLARAFRDGLEGEEFLTQPTLGWDTFHFVGTARCVHRNIVLIGDAATTKHFVIGSGTTHALCNARDLVECVATSRDIAQALERYQDVYGEEASALQEHSRRQARRTCELLELVAEGDDQDIRNFVFSWT